LKRDRGPGSDAGGRGPGGLGPYLRYLHLGTQMTILLLLGVFGGKWLDGKVGTSPALTVVGSVLGIGLGMAVVILEVGRKRR